MPRRLNTSLLNLKKFLRTRKFKNAHASIFILGNSRSSGGNSNSRGSYNSYSGNTHQGSFYPKSRFFKKRGRSVSVSFISEILISLLSFFIPS